MYNCKNATLDNYKMYIWEEKMKNVLVKIWIVKKTGNRLLIFNIH